MYNYIIYNKMHNYIIYNKKEELFFTNAHSINLIELLLNKYHVILYYIYLEIYM